jgi:hypothetical protein
MRAIRVETFAEALRLILFSKLLKNRNFEILEKKTKSKKFSLRRVVAEFTPIFKSVIYTVLGALPKAYHVLSKPKR